MSRTIAPRRPVGAITEIDALIARHGPGPILRAALLALLRRRRPRPPHAHDLSPHLRRDIGLPPSGGAQHPVPPRHWTGP